jgi:hypothetical protein
MAIEELKRNKLSGFNRCSTVHFGKYEIFSCPTNALFIET